MPVVHHNFTALPQDKAQEEQCCHSCIPNPTAQACGAAFRGTAGPHLCTPSWKGATWNCVYGSGGTVNMLFWPMTTPHLFRIRLPQTWVIRVRFQPGPRCGHEADRKHCCSGNGHRCQDKRRFRKAKRFEPSLCENLKLIISVPHRSFSKSCLHFRCFRAIAKAARFWSLFLIQSQND